MHKQKRATPWDGVPGFWAAVNRFFYPIAGPAQLGAGHPEEAPVAAQTRPCPLCGALMSEHRVERAHATGRTRVHCP